MNRRLWVVLLIMASLLPWRVALACAHQAGLIQQRCCCVEQHQACPSIKTGVGKCCKTTLAAPSQLADSRLDAVLLADGGKALAPPPFLPSAAADWISAGDTRVWPVISTTWRIGRDIYLRTARLRL